ncbi:MAG TPA: ADP-ribosylglycohydrolase family protein [Kofleriaceae bacterium]|nr:ADP-ribosylglycohydrolase family protein [Kofleriaceae bacterium]
MDGDHPSRSASGSWGTCNRDRRAPCRARSRDHCRGRARRYSRAYGGPGAARCPGTRRNALTRAAEPAELARELGLDRGVSGYVHHTVPACLYAWLRSPRDFRRAVGDVVLLGGDSDTTGAIVGALAGASAGTEAIPTEWLAIVDFPRSLAWIRALAHRLRERSEPLRLWWPAVPLRNALFTAIVLVVGLRRLLPPY